MIYTVAGVKFGNGGYDHFFHFFVQRCVDDFLNVAGFTFSVRFESASKIATVVAGQCATYSLLCIWKALVGA